MDFFARQQNTRRTSRLLLGAFIVAVLGTALAVTAAGATLLWLYDAEARGLNGSGLAWHGWAAARLPALGLIAALTLGLITIASLYRTATLARGGAQVARMLGGSEVGPDSTEPLQRRLLNVVEEMAIASGIPVPSVYVLEQEPGINAFAAGLTVSDAAIAVTRGALERLDRHELQGVIAHEFSHIVNGDMRLNQRLIGFAFGILIVSLAGRWLIRSQRHGWARRRHSGALVIGSVLAVIGSTGVLFSRLIKAAVSRQRELLADASAVQFTREPAGLAGALKKIGGFTGELSSVDGEEVSHMLFVRGAPAFRGLFASHPPLLTRIQALEPSFRAEEYPAARTPLPPPDAAHQEPLARQLAGTADFAADAGLLDRSGRIASPALAHALRAGLPEALDHAAHDRQASLLLVLALAVVPEPATRARQWQLLEQQLGAQRLARCRQLRAALDALDRRLHLPLLEIAMPALRQRPAEQLAFLQALLQRLIAAAPERRLFDVVLLELLAHYLDDLPHTAPAPRTEPPLDAAAALAALLRVVAAYGHASPAAARAAVTAGYAALGRRASIDASAFEPLSRAREPGLVEAALARLRRLSPRARRATLAATLATIRHDQRIELEELELFRAIAAALDVPMPPWQQDAVAALEARAR